ncbi:hypothetical protein Tsubulata_049083 [Turnera subulata]|uniref:RING-type E3 ubiquitin transferase n=1 Tax=Turnera subulata TaxID=218843 RepID=A0A9Q0F3J8_9ROSI|nr:hypothetical protein Tsubulata_049083 [Turnera subulata]
MVNPVVEEAHIKCPLCQSGFLEEFESTRDHNNNASVALGSARALSLLAPIFLDLMGGMRRSRALITAQEHVSSSSSSSSPQEDDRPGTELGSSGTNSPPLMNVGQDHRVGSEGSENNRERNGRSMILVNPFNEEAIILQLPFIIHRFGTQTQNLTGSFGDYLIGPGLDFLLQQLAENAGNHYGTPPADKAAVKAMPTVTVEQDLQCPVCLEEFEIGGTGKEMPCLHKFHDECIVRWLELHSSCPVCRFQMPCEEPKTRASRLSSSEEAIRNDNAMTSIGRVGDREERVENDRRNWIPMPWPFDGLFPVSESTNGGISTSVPSAANVPENASHTDEN